MSGLTRSDVEHLAARLRKAAGDRLPVPPLRQDFPAAGATEAYAVQAVNVGHALSRGRRIAGRKFGLALTERRSGEDGADGQAAGGSGQPHCGTIFADTVYGDGAELPCEELLQPRVEAKVALVLERDLTMADATIADLIRATAFVLPAIELADSRIAGWGTSLVDSIADNACAGLLVLGAVKRPLDGLDLRLCGMTLMQRGETLATGTGAACAGHPLNAAVWLARRQAAQGQPLCAGDLVLTGALAPMAAIAPGAVLDCRIGGLGSVRAVPGGGRAG